MKRLQFKGRKHGVTAICLVAGMFMLTSAVYANYDDARGYTNYKDAVKDLVFYDDNFSAEGDMSILVDGKPIATLDSKFKLDGKDYSLDTNSWAVGQDEADAQDGITVYKGGKIYHYYPAGNTYRVSDSQQDLRMDMNDPTIKKGVRFAELFADAMVGNLKNNFVLESKDGDERHYSVDVAGNQIPEIVNAGISLMFTAANNEQEGEPFQVNYQDYMKAFAKYYEEQTGEKLTEDLYNKGDAAVGEINDDFIDQYQAVLDKAGSGIVYVKGDGTYKVYKTYEAYYNDVPANNLDRDVVRMLGDDPYIENASCNFTLNKEGKLTANTLKATMAGVDDKGKKHTITMKINYKITDYGHTQVEDFDTTGKIRADY